MSQRCWECHKDVEDPEGIMQFVCQPCRQDAYEQGYSDGEADGHNLGYERGLKQGKAEAEDDNRKEDET